MASAEIETGNQLLIQYNEQGLAPAIVQDRNTGRILMVAWMNADAVAHTIETGKATFYSRSRKKMWVKGESSGHVMNVHDLRVDCDQDVILLKVEPAGPACHVGYDTCFYRSYDKQAGELKTVEDKSFDPDAVYGK
jgi:phosphoribosyl-AMP cyclohydrolase